ncbi:hypothetical protein [Listeria booriae]|nr:hypothetical protein [Listeria booriae]
MIFKWARIGLSETVVAAGVQERSILFFSIGALPKGFYLAMSR